MHILALTNDWNLLFTGQNFLNLLLGLWVTIRIALISMIGSIILGVFLGIALTTKNRIIHVITILYVEILRLTPQLVLLFVVFFGVAKTLEINIGGETAAIIVFTLWGTAEMGDLVRGALQSIPANQKQSALALGMSSMQTMRYVTLPLAFRQLIPLTVNLTTRMIKTTSLISMIGVIEILKMAQVIIDRGRFDYPDAALWIYGAVFFLYFIACYAISLFAAYLERKLSL